MRVDVIDNQGIGTMQAELEAHLSQCTIAACHSVPAQERHPVPWKGSRREAERPEGGYANRAVSGGFLEVKVAKNLRFRWKVHLFNNAGTGMALCVPTAIKERDGPTVASAETSRRQTLQRQNRLGRVLPVSLLPL